MQNIELNSSVLIKLSGKAIDAAISDPSFSETVRSIRAEGKFPIVIHGASIFLNDWEQRWGLQTRFKDGQRVTDSLNIGIVVSLQSGLVNKSLVKYLRKMGLNALGLSGIDLGICTVTDKFDELGLVGRPDFLFSAEIYYKLQNCCDVLVISPIGSDDQGNFININADIFASELVKYLGCQTVYFISDVPGIYLDQWMSDVTIDDLISGLETGKITGGMIVKIREAISLIDNGVEKIWIGSRFPGDPANGIEVGNHGTWIH